ncbi:MAG: L,D-transpeptidase family protein [Bacillota bacterium]
MQPKISCLLVLMQFFFLICPGFAAEPFRHCGCHEINRTLELKEPCLNGKDVRELQERLLELGYSPGPLDGFFGPLTEKALKAFQTANNLPATGRTDNLTWEALAKGALPVVNEKATKPTGKVELAIDLEKRTLTIFSDGEAFKTYPVAIGTSADPSPVGTWRIVHKSTDWGGGFGTRWLGLNVPWGIYGIHGTNKPWSIGQAASHGCFRMHNRHVEEMFPWIPVGTKVVVIGKEKTMPARKKRIIRPGSSGQDVAFVQLRLREMGFYLGLPDARYGYMTGIGINYLKTLHGLSPDGIVNEETYRALGY